MTLRPYFTAILLSWQDSLVYRFNALVWAAYTVLPSLTLMMVWIAVYNSSGRASLGGYTLPGMISYYFWVTALRVAITVNPEWDIATQIRDGKITGFIVRPIGYYGYRMATETAYQGVKFAMTLPGMLLLAWGFRAYLQWPSLSLAGAALFGLSVLLAFALLTQLKFCLGISAFWFAEIGGLIEVWNIVLTLLGGGLLPLSLLPSWLRIIGDWTPFPLMYAFPLDLLQNRLDTNAIAWAFARQAMWLVVMSGMVRLMWRRGLLAYEAYGG